MFKVLKRLGLFLFGGGVTFLSILAAVSFSLVVFTGLVYAWPVIVAAAIFFVAIPSILNVIAKYAIERNIRSSLRAGDMDSLQLWLALANKGEFNDNCWKFQFQTDNNAQQPQSLMDFARVESTKAVRTREELHQAQSYIKVAQRFGGHRKVMLLLKLMQLFKAVLNGIIVFYLG